MSDYTEQQFGNSNTIENKANVLAQNTQKKITGLATGNWDSATLESYPDADSPVIAGVTGGVGKGGNLSGVATEDRDPNFDAYEVAHPSDPYRNTQSGIAKYERQRQRLEEEVKKDPTLVQKLSIKDPSRITDDDIARAGTREQLLGLYSLIPGDKQPWEPGPLDYYDRNRGIELGSKENPLNIEVERRAKGDYDYFGRPLAEIRNKDTDIRTVDALDYDGTEDTKYSALKAASRLREEGSLTPELEKYLTKSTPRYQGSNTGEVDLSGSTEAIRPLRQGIADRLASAPGALAGSVAGGVVGVADFLTGGRVIGGENVEAVNRSVGKALGYDKVLYKADDARRQELMNETFKDVQALSPESYKNIDWEKAGELFKEGVTDPILIAQSLGMLVGGGGIGGAGIKAGIKLLSKGDEVIAAANKAKELVAANTALTAADRAAEIAKIESGITLGNKIGNLAVKGSGAAGYGAAITSEDISEYAKNNNGELPGVGQMLGMFTANTLAVALPEIASTKFVLGMGKAAEESARKATIGKAVGAALGHVAMSGLVELPQETIQAAVQTVNQRLGTEKYKDKTVSEIVNGATADILGQGVIGAGSGVAMGSMKPAADITKGIGNASVDVANELLEKAGITDVPEVEAKKEVYNLKEYENIAPEDRAAKTKDVIQYATLMIVDPREAKDNGYERGRVRLADVVDKVAKINEIADENKQYIYRDVMDGIKSTLVAYAKTDSNAAKMEVFKEMLKSNKSPEATKAINNEIDNVVTEELDSVSAKLSDALGKHVDLSTVKISDEEMTKINGVIAQLRGMGSEELKNKALAIEDVIKGLGRKKSWEDVRDDIKKVGFVFFGKSYKSLEKHDDDISREIALGTGIEETEKLVNFVNSRNDQRVRFEEERSGKIVDRSLQPLRAFAEINNKDNEDIMKTIDGLLVKAKDGTDNKRLLEESKATLQGIMNKYDAMIASNTVDEFKGLYTGKVEPKVVEKPERDVDKAQKELVDKIISKSESADQALVVFNNMKNAHKLDQETRSRLEDQIRNAEKFSKAEPETKSEKKTEVVKEEGRAEEQKAETKTETKKPESKVLDKELETISKPVAEFKETMSDLEYYTQAENWSKEANQKAKADLKKTNERLRAIYKELDGLTSSKEQVQSKLDRVKEDIRTISRRITSTNNKLDRMETTSWKLVAEVMDGLKNLVNDVYKVLYRLLKLKEIKQFKADKLLSELKAINVDKKSLIEEMKQLKELKSEQVDKVVMEANELKEIKQRLADAEKAVFSTTYGEDSAKLFKKVDSEKVTLTNKFSEDVKAIEEVNKLVGQGNKKREVIKNVTEKLAEDIKELMPKSVLKRLSKDSELLSKAIETFMDYRYGEVKKISIPRQEKGSALEFLNSWLDNPELNSRLHLALDVAGIVTMDDMMSTRTLNSSMLEDLIDGAFGVKKDDPAFKGIKKDIQSGKYVPMSSFTKSAGAKVVSDLGLKFDDKQVSMQDKQDVQFALGQLVLERAKLQLSQEVKAGTIGIVASSITLETKDGEVIGAKVTEGYEEGIDTDNVKRIVDLSGIKNKKGLRELSSVLEYAGEKTDGELQFEPTVINENKSVRNSNVKMSKDAVEYINKNNKIGWKFSDEFKELYVMAQDKAKKDKTSINEVMYELLLDDITNDKLKGMTVDDIESELAKREAEKLEIDRMLMGYELAGSEQFYLNWDQTISGRYMIANKMINPQNSKIVRFLVQTEDMKSSLTRGENGYNGKDIGVIKGAIAQAFDYGIDKDSDANVFAKMSRELVSINENGTEIKYPDTEKGKQLKEAVKAYRGLDIVKAVEVLKDMGIGTNERMHTLQALKVLSGLEQQKEINHGLVVEIDAITNGMILTLLEIGSEWAMDMLAKGGIYWGANKGKYENHGEFKQAGGVDIYQTPVELLTGMIDDGSKVGNMITGVLGDNLGKWRNALKPLVMVYIYGAGMKSIVSKAGTEFSDLLMRNFIKTNDVNGLTELLKEAGISTDRLEFVSKAKLLRGEVKVVTGRLTESNMGDLRLTPYQVYQLNKKISDTVGPALEESFERSFKEISEYRKVLKTAEILNYVVFKQELNRVVKDRETITIDELNKVLAQMQKDGTYYGAVNSSGSVQDYAKLGTEGSKGISVTGFYNKSASGKTTEITVNSALKWFKSNIGAVGVTAVHDKDGRVMAESDNDGTLNIYDAKVLPASYKVANKNSIEMNKAVLDVSRNHSILAEAVEKVDRLLGKIDLKGIDKELTKELVEDMNRVYGENNWISGTEFAEKLKEIRDNRTNNVSREMDVNHVYALDSLEGIKAGEGEVRTIELTDDEIDSIGSKLDEVTGKVGQNVQDKLLDKRVESELNRQGMSKEDKSIIDDELKKAGTDLLAVIRQLVKGCKE